MLSAWICLSNKVIFYKPVQKREINRKTAIKWSAAVTTTSLTPTSRWQIAAHHFSADWRARNNMRRLQQLAAGSRALGLLDYLLVADARDQRTPPPIAAHQRPQHNTRTWKEKTDARNNNFINRVHTLIARMLLGAARRLASPHITSSFDYWRHPVFELFVRRAKNEIAKLWIKNKSSEKNRTFSDFCFSSHIAIILFALVTSAGYIIYDDDVRFVECRRVAIWFGLSSALLSITTDCL